MVTSMDVVDVTVFSAPLFRGLCIPKPFFILIFRSSPTCKTLFAPVKTLELFNNLLLK